MSDVFGLGVFLYKGYLLGVLMRRESYYLGVYFRVVNPSLGCRVSVPTSSRYDRLTSKDTAMLVCTAPAMKTLAWEHLDTQTLNPKSRPLQQHPSPRPRIDLFNGSTPPKAAKCLYLTVAKCRSRALSLESPPSVAKTYVTMASVGGLPLSIVCSMLAKVLLRCTLLRVQGASEACEPGTRVSSAPPAPQ